MRKLIVSPKEAKAAWESMRTNLLLDEELCYVQMHAIRFHALIEERLGEKYPGNPLDDPRTRVFHNTCKRCGTSFMSTGRPLKLCLCERCLKQDIARLHASRAYKLRRLIDWEHQPMEDR